MIIQKILEIAKMVAIGLALLFVVITVISMIVRGSDLTDKVKMPWDKKETKAERRERLEEERKRNWMKGDVK